MSKRSPHVGRPDKDTLLEQGRITPAQMLDVNPNPSVKVEKYNRETGRMEIRYECRGHATGPDGVWRVGHTPEKHRILLLKEMQKKARGGQEKIAPDLTDEEFADFKKLFPKEAAYIEDADFVLPKDVKSLKVEEKPVVVEEVVEEVPKKKGKKLDLK